VVEKKSGYFTQRQDVVDLFYSKQNGIRQRVFLSDDSPLLSEKRHHSREKYPTKFVWLMLIQFFNIQDSEEKFHRIEK